MDKMVKIICRGKKAHKMVKMLKKNFALNVKSEGECELKPEFIAKIKRREKQKSVEINVDDYV